MKIASTPPHIDINLFLHYLVPCAIVFVQPWIAIKVLVLVDCNEVFFYSFC